MLVTKLTEVQQYAVDGLKHELAQPYISPSYMAEKLTTLFRSEGLYFVIMHRDDKR